MKIPFPKNKTFLFRLQFYLKRMSIYTTARSYVQNTTRYDFITQ